MEDNKKYRNKTETKQHSFNVEDAVNYGMEKAVLLYNLKFWLEKDKANKTNIHKHTDEKEYYWTFNSGEAFAKLFPYMNRSKIARLLRELEKDGILYSNNFNKYKYDKTKWYTIPTIYLVEKE